MLYAFWGFWFGLYFLIDRFTSANRKMMKIFAISLLLLIPQSFEAHVSYLAHFIGFLVGITTGVTLFLRRKGFIRSFERYRYIHEPLSNLPPEEEYWNFEINPNHEE